MSYEHRQPCERPQQLSINFSELAKKCRDPARSCVHIIIINQDCEQIHAMCIPMHSQHLWQQWRFFRASI